MSINKQIKDRDLEIIELKEKIKAIHDFKKEKENFEKNYLNLMNNLNTLKDELEKKNQIIKSFQKQINQSKPKRQNQCNPLEEVEEKSNLTWNNMPIPWKIIIKEKDKKIIMLEKEINCLNNEIYKLNRDIQNLRGGSMSKIKINCLPMNISNINQNTNNLKGNKEKIFISSLDAGK